MGNCEKIWENYWKMGLEWHYQPPWSASWGDKGSGSFVISHHCSQAVNFGMKFQGYVMSPTQLWWLPNWVPNSVLPWWPPRNGGSAPFWDLDACSNEEMTRPYRGPEVAINPLGMLENLPSCVRFGSLGVATFSWRAHPSPRFSPILPSMRYLL